jgi:hypothetical protein
MGYVENFKLQKLIGQDVDNTIKEQVLSRVYEFFKGHKYLVNTLYKRLKDYPERPTKEEEVLGQVYLDELLDIPIHKLMKVLLSDREYKSYQIDLYF